MLLFTDLFKMINDIRRKSFWLGKWGQFLNFPMLFAPIFFHASKVVWIVFVCNLVAVLIAAQIHKKTPFSRLTSICHLAWLPMFYFMFAAFQYPKTTSFLKGWLYYVAITVTISLALDIFNLFKFAIGDRSEIG